MTTNTEKKQAGYTCWRRARLHNPSDFLADDLRDHQRGRGTEMYSAGIALMGFQRICMAARWLCRAFSLGGGGISQRLEANTSGGMKRRCPELGDRVMVHT